MKLFVGIDPGLRGGVTVVDKNEKIHKKVVIPVIKQKNKTKYDSINLYLLLSKLRRLVHKNQLWFVLEQAAVRPISGKRACFMNGYGYGLIRGILVSLDANVMIVSPQKWMKALDLSSKNGKGSIQYCKEKYPREDWTATARSKKPHDGLTDSCAIAIYGKRLFYNQ